MFKVWYGAFIYCPMYHWSLTCWCTIILLILDSVFIMLDMSIFLFYVLRYISYYQSINFIFWPLVLGRFLSPHNRIPCNRKTPCNEKTSDIVFRVCYVHCMERIFYYRNRQHTSPFYWSARQCSLSFDYVSICERVGSSSQANG